jgi:hypothetical protein
MRLISSFICWTLIGWTAMQVAGAGKASINEAQERRAEALCQLQPESCGQRRYDPTIR